MVLPADAKLETELARFRRIQDVALVAIISRDYKIPFTTFSKMIEGPPPLTPGNALVRLRNQVEARQMILKARPEVRRLIEMRESAGGTNP